MLALLRRLIREDEGSDIIEYALLTGSIGLAGAATWPLISAALGTAYSTLDTQTQAIWSPPDPAGGGS
jgi:Flp pilus assembly pilin Flp